MIICKPYLSRSLDKFPILSFELRGMFFELGYSIGYGNTGVMTDNRNIKCEKSIKNTYPLFRVPTGDELKLEKVTLNNR